MNRFLMAVSVAVLGFGATAHAGGPPPVYVVVDKVVVEPSTGAAERIKIQGSFVRVEKVRGYDYGKPVEGYVYLSIGAGKEEKSRAEWEKWQKAAGTGKVIAVGMCSEAGAMLTVKIRKSDERTTEPDAVYTPGHIEGIDHPNADRMWEREAPVKELLAFVKTQKEAAKAKDQPARR